MFMCAMTDDAVFNSESKLHGCCEIWQRNRINVVDAIENLILYSNTNLIKNIWLALSINKFLFLIEVVKTATSHNMKYILIIKFLLMYILKYITKYSFQIFINNLINNLTFYLINKRFYSKYNLRQYTVKSTFLTNICCLNSHNVLIFKLMFTNIAYRYSFLHCYFKKII